MPALMGIGFLVWGLLTGCRTAVEEYSPGTYGESGSSGNPLRQGIARQWDSDGKLVREQSYYRGLLRWEKQWDAQGNLVFKRFYKSAQHSLPDGVYSGLIQKYTFYVKEGKAILHGPVSCLTQDGKLVRQWSMQEGRREGPYTEWHVDGGISRQGTYSRDLKQGLWLAYHENGLPAFQGSYRKGIKEGPHLYWHFNGTLQSKALYKEGKLQGEAQSWYASGRFKEKRMGPEDYAIASWYPNGQMAYVLRGNPHHGKAMRKWWYSNGQLRCRIKYRDGDTHGKTQTWHQNGSPFVTARYHTGQLNGTVKTWSDKGLLVSRQEFHGGELVEDPDRNRLAAFFEAQHADLPLEFAGFRWGMNHDQVTTQIKRLRGRVIGKGEDGLNAVIQFPGLSRPMAFTLSFNPWGELCTLRGRLPSVSALNLPRYRNWMEGELQAQMITSRNAESVRRKTLKQAKSWGAFQTKANGTSGVHPVVEVQLTYDTVLEELNISLENHLMRLYANPSAAIVSGPRYPRGNT